MELIKHVENGIYFITINRESSLNALNKNVMHLLESAIQEVNDHIHEYKGVIITGSGPKSFVAGADITELLGLSHAEGEALSLRGQKIFQDIERLSIPVIAAVNGFALGGGCELAMACHMRVASENAKFGQPEVNLGLIPGYGGTQRLIRYIGKPKAFELLLTGDMINAEEAYRLNLVNYVVPIGSEISKSIEIIEKSAKKGPRAIAKAIELMNEHYDFERDAFAHEAKLFGELLDEEESQEGIQAFINKTKPNFRR
ncbi:MAG: enoyl-CoA hydratase/isomerase family protein [Saprospiraceae bacterium]|mgnify:FL=1|jgi:enoyl-CoA hydratase|nr:enoyl-CoA hydratase/isomerase family protein [Candidatus Defluviibacterium haderslevense]MCC7026452.1 enoyl-CoA hydratase/isomerase family protein [Saprospiraceae bacterium]MBK7244086.1 enoyl-CoA hydratase/isomerase family protein [Candidatus Defluviibacterium haderslevense]MBK8245427.1 enoyl-CoA hydratase/isomerase family protein [Candidatus Defluviibacterium haderslevense]MBL0236850.1 enoyl-CoA hydratase/isomerase family protein [Candidatus Defluviibacterium haderslevense]